MQEAPRKHRFSSPGPLEDQAEDALLFAGREEELNHTFRLLQMSTSLVLYGQVGVGRTTLLNVGLKPTLRDRGFLPLSFSWKQGSAEQPFAGIASALPYCGDYAVERAAAHALEQDNWTLTSLFQALAETVAANKHPIVLLIDDFESIFALYPAETRGRIMRELADVLMKRYPVDGVDTADAQRAQWKDAPTVKLLISMHQEHLGSLDEFREVLPELLTRRIRLAAPNWHQTYEILHRGAMAELPNPVCEPFFLDEAVAAPLLAHSRLRNLSPGDANQELYDLFLAKLLGSHVESLMSQEQREVEEDAAATKHPNPADSGEDGVTLALDPEQLHLLLPKLLRDYYEQRLQGIPPQRLKRVVNLMEASLYGALSQEHGISRRLLDRQYGIAPDLVDELTARHLLRETVGNQGFTYCLWHDSLREGIRQVRRERNRIKRRKVGYALVAITALATVGFHLIPKPKLAPEMPLTANTESMRERYADSPQHLESMLRLESEANPEKARPLWDLLSLQEEQGKHVEALQTVASLEKITPAGSPSLLRRKALLLERVGLRSQSAEVHERLLESLTASNPEIEGVPQARTEEIARIHENLGQLKAEEGKVDQAKSHFQKAIETLNSVGITTDRQREELARIHTGLANLAVRMELPQEAAAQFGAALEAVPSYSPALEGRAALRLKEGREEDAIADLAKVAERSPENLLVSFQQAQALQSAGRFNEALAVIDGLIQKYPDNASLHLRKAQVLQAQKQDDAALAAFNKTLELDERNSDALMGRAQILTTRDIIPAAIADYTKVIELHPELARAYGNRGILYRKMREPEKALADYTQVLKIDPSDAHIFYLRGNLLLDMNKLAEALLDFDKAIQLDPKNAKAYNNRGFVLSMLGRYKEAIQDFGKAIEIDPVYAEAYSNRGFAIYSDTQSTQALADFHRAIILEPAKGHGYVNRGRYYLEIEEFESALKDFDKAVELNAEDAEAYRFRAQVLVRLGQAERAQSDMAKAESLDAGT